MRRKIPRLLHTPEFLYASRALLVPLYLQKVAKTIVAERDSHEMLVVHGWRSTRRPQPFVDFPDDVVLEMERDL